ncbi:MAG: 2,3-bisphosphoglycerate-independent phosphoglycerate mutase [Candidatus Doudnabacteria bacterium]|nr:2,3-bisphosphoglycerate-independent phosphoglycerate mutase [Candidatus Doudnabacteria bacterium]
MPKFKQVVLLILDGFGVASPSEGNAVVAANPRNLNYLINHYPATTLQASGPSVGLPWGERGNSEVGHLNLGAGRIVSQDLPRISQAIASGEFFKNRAFLSVLEHVQSNQSRLHLVGLVSSGGVHSSDEHLHALLALAAEYRLPQVYVHMITDGRDTPPKAALSSLERLTRKFLEHGVGKVATVAGRFYAMDRGAHWEVTESVYRAMVYGEGERAISPRDAIEHYYDQQIYDETIPPTVITEGGQPVATVGAGDGVIFFNFRPDRALQLFSALADPNFDKFSQKYAPLENLLCATMTLYNKNLPAMVAFPPLVLGMGLSEVLSRQGLHQYHIAESEKYAHVTSFFNGGREEPFPGEEREIISSPSAYQKSYEDVPEMSVDQLGTKIVQRLREGTAFILANFANSDMVGHTGNRRAAEAAVLAVDKNIGTIFEAAQAVGAAFVITADHGNIEELLNARSGQINKEHSLNPVPLIIAGKGLERQKIKSRGYLELPALVPEGVLSDVAPTALELMGIVPPPEMTAISLLPALVYEKSLETKI